MNTFKSLLFQRLLFIEATDTIPFPEPTTKISSKVCRSLRNIFVNFILHIRNNNNYAFSNIFLIASVEVDGELFSRDTLEYELANSKGEWLGDGFTEVKESRLWWKEDFIVPKGEQINVMIEHAVRSNGIENGIDNLEGIIGVGLSTEKINLN